MQLAEKQELIIAIGSFIADAVERATRPLLDRIAALEAKSNHVIEETPWLTEDKVRSFAKDVLQGFPIPKDGVDGKDGKDFDVEECRVLLKNLVDEAVSLIPKAKDGVDGKDGKDGIDGKSITVEDTYQLITNEVASAVAAVIEATPLPKDGKDGVDGKDGKDGVDGKDGNNGTDGKDGKDGIDGTNGVDGKDGVDVSIEECKSIIDDLVTQAVSSIPKPKDGLDGKDGINGKDGLDGINLADALMDDKGNLVLVMSNGTTKELGRVKGKDGEPGKDGLDGVGFDDLSFEYDGERGMKLVFAKGDVVKEWPITLLGFVDRGVYKEGETYIRGDAVSWGGSLWMAQSDTTSKPGDGEKSWRLAVKKGRDGKDGKAGKDGINGKDGKDFVRPPYA